MISESSAVGTTLKPTSPVETMLAGCFKPFSASVCRLCSLWADDTIWSGGQTEEDPRWNIQLLDGIFEKWPKNGFFKVFSESFEIPYQVNAPCAHVCLKLTSPSSKMDQEAGYISFPYFQ